MSRGVALIQIPVGTGDRLYCERRDLPYGIELMKSWRKP
jgi:hypothetical protein